MKILKKFIGLWKDFNAVCIHQYSPMNTEGKFYDDFTGLVINKKIITCKLCKKRFVWKPVGTYVELKELPKQGV
jgi:hypothetical protein